jgi:hypothetical protein
MKPQQAPARLAICGLKEILPKWQIYPSNHNTGFAESCGKN